MEVESKPRAARVRWIDCRIGIVECSACGNRWILNYPGLGNRYRRGSFVCANGCRASDARPGARPTEEEKR